MELTYKSLIPTDPGNKYMGVGAVGASPSQTNSGYYSSSNVWYTLRMEIDHDGTANAPLGAAAIPSALELT